MPVANLLPSHSQESCSSRTGESIFQTEKQGKKEGKQLQQPRAGKAHFRCLDRRGVALLGHRSRPRAASVAVRSRGRRDFRVGGILNAAMAQTVQNVTLSLTLPITCHICLGKVMGDSGHGYESGSGVQWPARAEAGLYVWRGRGARRRAG